MYTILITVGTKIIAEGKSYKNLPSLVEDNEALPDETYIQSEHTGTVLTLREARLFVKGGEAFIANW